MLNAREIPASSNGDQSTNSLRQRAFASHERGELALAELLYREILGRYPDDLQVTRSLGVLALQTQRYDWALQLLTEVWQFDQGADVNDYLGNALCGLNRLEESLQFHERAIALEPDYASAHINRAHVLRSLGRHTEAAVSYVPVPAPAPAPAPVARAMTDCAVSLGIDSAELRTGDATALVRRAIDLQKLGRLDEALADCNAAVASAPELADAYIVRGALLRDLGRFDEAIASFTAALARRVDPLTNFALGCLYLLTGDFHRGWPLYDFYSQVANSKPVQRARDVPRWHGDAELRGKILHLYADQGLGDTLQFTRYALMAEARGATVIMSVQNGLCRLMRSLNPPVQILGETQTPANYDYQANLSSLPGAFGTTAESVPAAIPYLQAETERSIHWRARLGTAGFKIGVCWQGSNQTVGIGRSFALRLLEPISRLSGVRLISLQKHDGLEQLDDLPAGMTVETLGPEFDAGPDAFLDTAAVIECLDLVITCDTSIAHLAGALGARAWVALQRVPDWRWLLQRRDSPWYPTLRLFRQTSDGDFGAVMQLMCEELGALLPQQSLDAIAAPHSPSAAGQSAQAAAETALVTTERALAATESAEGTLAWSESEPELPAAAALPTNWRTEAERLAPIAVSCVLVLLLCVEIVNAAKAALSRDSTKMTAASPLALNLSSPARVDPAGIAASHLFGAVVSEQDPASEPLSASDLTLTGTLATADPRRGFAIIGEQGNSHVYSIGNSLGAVSVQAVYRDRVIIARNGLLESLFLPRSRSAGPPSMVRSISPSAAEPGDVALEESTPLIDTFADSNPQTDAAGAMLGIRVVPGKDREAFANSGLVGGDIVVAVNGTKIDSEQSKALWNQAGTGTAVTVLRRGVMKDLTLNFSP